ncbi:polyprenyl synthetase family protein [Zafaria sp. Z1313]|uniref:polyprenyl synthetase family protein n=1 Tax=unclassified Zafaria TaxID=2828765 RepID=UPI002E785414|nr:polyprenyl synthetase family protein [Zafaria sp. J156]MEE1620300.1 polyprenyl synthetase family protein [Zafaria sp. J156]
MSDPSVDTTLPRPDASRYAEAVDGALTAFLDGQLRAIRDIAEPAGELIVGLQELVRGGKRMRPRFAYWGFAGAGGDPGDPLIVQAGAALELFQAAALIHDDLIDRSDTRRGRPSMHRRFEAIHRGSGWQRDAGRFGEAAAVLAGDLCLSFSEQLFGTIHPLRPAAREIFDRMRTEVMAGQFLDVLEESAGPSQDPAEAAGRARRILRYKSAKYSAENPLLLGGALAGASDELLAAYSAYALPLGEAFQLRDDILGVFGDPAQTGKPAGDDLREGKRTELVAHAVMMSPPADRDFINARLGAEDLTDGEVARLRDILRGAGALEATEASIAGLSAQAFAALEAMPVDEAHRAALRALGEAAITRVK